MSLLDRRRLLTSGTAAAVFAASGVAGLAMPKRGGMLRAGLSGGAATDSWDSRGHAGLFMIAAAQGAVFDTLIEVAPDGSLRGELAIRWQASTDARVWTVNLRPDVVFHNGKRFVAEDVIASLRLHLAPAAASPALPLVSSISEMRKTGLHQVRFTLAHSNADFPYLLADYHLLMYPAGQIEQAMAEGIGTGLYRVELFEPGHRFIGRRVQNHYRDGQAGWFDEIDFIALNAIPARREALENRQIDVADHAGTSGFDTDMHRVQRVAGNQHLTLSVTAQDNPVNHSHLVRGLKHGLDRQALLDGVFDGSGRIAADTPIGPANRYFNPNLDPLGYDPEAALFHFKKAGIDSASLRVALPNSAPFAPKDMMGLLPDLIRARRQQFVSGAMPSKGVADLTVSLGYGRATEDWMCSSGFSTVRYEAAERAGFAVLHSAARSETDSAKRREYYYDLQDMMRNEGTLVVPVFGDFSHVMHRRLANPARLGTLWPLDNARLAERWWMA
ncbi:MAG: ABC transporter substrate-binding protein [Rhodobacterales bacterium]